MPVVIDKEFGEIALRRSVRASQVRIRVAPNGKLRASLPLYAPVFLVKRLINSSRPQLRQLLEEHQATFQFEDGMQIGKSHTLIVRQSSSFSVARHKQHIIAALPDHIPLSSIQAQAAIRQEVLKAFRIEARSYLSRRLEHLAGEYDFSYTKLRFSHSSGRWGSCNSNGVISLNIALMKLPFHLIDYVLIHELSHTVEMNHSRAFWTTVENINPDYRLHRSELKNHSPSI